MLVFNQKIIFSFLLLIYIVSIPFKNSVYQASVVFLILFFIFSVFKHKDIDSIRILLGKYKDIIVSFLFIIVVMIISNLNSSTLGDDSWRDILIYIYRYGFIFFILIYFYYKSFFSKRLLIYFILISLSIQSIDGIYQAIYGFDLFKENPGDLQKGLTGVTFNRNTFGMFMGLGLIIIFLSINKKDFFYYKNYILYLLFAMFIFSTLFSYSRAVWVSLVFCFIALFWMNMKNFELKHYLYLMFFLILLIMVFLTFDSLENRFILLLNGNSSHRFEIWNHSIEMILNKPILGWGLDSWMQIGYAGYSNVHNLFLEILLYLGVLGFLSYVVFIFITLKELFITKEFNLFIVFIYLFIDSQFDQSITSGKVFLSTLVVLVFFIFSNRIEYNYKKR